MLRALIVSEKYCTIVKRRREYEQHKYMERFNELLLDYYNTGAYEELEIFLYENAIQGMSV